MNKHKYFFRGVGIALIMAASIFYFIGLDSTEKVLTEAVSDNDIISRAKELGMVHKGEVLKEKEKLTEDEIIAKARMLGMVFKEEVQSTDEKIDEDTKTINENNEQSQNDSQNTNVKEEENDNTAEETSDEIKTVKVKISYGMSSDDVSELLFSKGIVDSANGLNRYLIRNNYDARLKTGTYIFNLNSTYKEIMKKITN